MTNDGKRATMDDVARLAKVSRQTVSRVLNNSVHVKSPTKQRVLKAITELDFRRDASARSLALRRTFVLGVLTSSFSRYVHSRTLEGAESYARAHGYSVFISGCDATSTGEPLSSPLIRHQPVEALIILYDGATSDCFSVLGDVPKGVPIVTTGYASGLEFVDAVKVANASGAEIATERLLRDGRRLIAMITGPRWDFDAIERRLGYERALAQFSIDASDEYVREGDWTLESGYEAMREILASGKAIDGLFAHNDQQAVGAIRAIHEARLRVPEDIAVVGFDDIPLAKYVEPSLTTMRYPSFALGETCARRLITRLESVSATRDGFDFPHGQLIPEIVVRESCS